MSDSFELLHVERITVGTVGVPGQRVFFLQAGQAGDVVTLKMEKVQVAALVAWIAKTLEDLPAPGPLPDELEPSPFDEPAWAIGSLGGTYDIDMDRIILVAEELSVDATEEGADDIADPTDIDDVVVDPAATSARGPATARFAASREQMAALAIRGTTLVTSGRPTCPLCGYPLDPIGHACPRTNGHRPPQL